MFNFTARYINNSLPTRQNLARWGLLPTSDCPQCLAPEKILHVVAVRQSYLERFTWRHDSILNFLATNLQTVNDSCIYVDLPGYKSPSIITGDTYRPDLLLSTSSRCLYIIELTVGFESNLQKNVERKKSKNKACRTQELSAELTVTRGYWRKQNPPVCGEILRVFRHACQKCFKILPHTRGTCLRQCSRVAVSSADSSRVRQA